MEAQRLTYPGWLILPHGNRESLWVYTEFWLNYLPNVENIPLGLDIKYAFELVWRLERCLLPIFNNVAEFCERILRKYWPFQDESPVMNSELFPEDRTLLDLPDESLKQAWLTIAMAMLRFYRVEGYLDKWKIAANK